VARRPLAWSDCEFKSRHGHGCLSLVSFACCQIEVSEMGRSLARRSPVECGVSEYELEISVRMRPKPTRPVQP